MFGMSLICSKLELIIYWGDVLPKKKKDIYYGIMIIHLMAVIITFKRQQKSFAFGILLAFLVQDAHEHAQNCDSCQRTGGMSKHNEVSL